MHPFPPSSELQFLVGQEFEQISLDPFSVQFHFESGGQITVEHHIEHVDAELSYRYDCRAEGGPALYLHRLLQQRITAVDAEPLCLTLSFASGAMLRIYSEIGPYECGQIHASADQKTLIVF